jgi:hypothetical protein
MIVAMPVAAVVAHGMSAMTVVTVIPAMAAMTGERAGREGQGRDGGNAKEGLHRMFHRRDSR